VLCIWGRNKHSRNLLNKSSEDGANMWLFPELFYSVNLTAQSAKLCTGEQRSWQLPKRASQRSKQAPTTFKAQGHFATAHLNSLAVQVSDHSIMSVSWSYVD